MTGLPANLPNAARAYLAAFPPGRIEAFPIHALDRLGVPVWIVALFLDDGPPGLMPSGIGYGATDADAITGALGEIAEALFPTLTLRAAPRETASYHDLARVHGEAHVTDPLCLVLPAGSPVDGDTVLDWVRATRHATGESVLVPIDIAACDLLDLPPGYGPFTTPITNGLGAGPDVAWAVGHGVGELLQRDGNGLRFRALDQGVLLDLDVVSGEARALVERFTAAGVEVLPKFATDQFGLTNLYVTGRDTAGYAPPAPISLSACGEACDADRDRALVKALHEFAAARSRKAFAHGPLALAGRVAPPGYVDRFIAYAEASLVGEETRALAAMTVWSRMGMDELAQVLAPVHRVCSRKAFSTLPTTPGDGRALAIEALNREGFDVLYVDCSPADRSIAVVKAIVPGLEVEQMSYGRIGARGAAILAERNDPLLRHGEPTAEARPIRLTRDYENKLNNPLFDTALADRIVGDLYPLYREPEAFHVAWAQARGA